MPKVDWTEVNVSPSTTWTEQNLEVSTTWIEQVILPGTTWSELIEEFYNWDDAIDEYEIANLSWEEIG